MIGGHKIMKRKYIVFEINEIPNRVIDTFVEENPDSHWAAITAKSARFIAATPDQLQLHPKLSWQTFHRGVPDVEHGFVEYNQTEAEGKGKFPPIWEIIKDAGKSVGCGASIGSYPIPENTQNIDFYLTDPFAPTFETVPAYLGHFQKLNNLAVQRSGRNVRRGGFGLSEVAGLLLNLPRLGISLSTITKTVRQLLSERTNSARIVRRRNIQALMSFDVVFKQIKNSKPDFSTIFANHVAASMHRYWAAKFPNDYEDNKMPEEWRQTYGGEIDAAMHEADYMLGRVDKFVKANPEFSVLVIASMGQEAIEHEVVLNQLIIGDFDAFMSSLGFKPDEYKKLTGMEPEYVVEFSDPSGLQKFKDICGKVDINGQRPHVKPSSERQCSFLVFQNNVDIQSISVDGQAYSLDESGLVIDNIQDMSGSTAQHIPGGCCFVFNGFSDLSAHSDLESEHNLVSVTSSILQALDINSSSYMQKPIPAIVNAMTEQPNQSGTSMQHATANG